MKYIDRPEVSEVFADRLEHLFFDGTTVRMEFTVTRTDPAQVVAGKPAAQPRQWSYSACRVVLSARGASELLSKMQELHALLLQQGVLQPRPPEPGASEPLEQSPFDPPPQSAP